MKKKKNYAKTLSFAVTEEQLMKLEKVSRLTGMNISKVVRALIDSSIPDLDPNDPYWRRVGASGIFSMELPRDAIVPFIANWLNLSLTGLRKIDNVEVIPCPESGITPTFWALEKIRRAFYDKSVRERTDQHYESQGEAPLT